MPPSRTGPSYPFGVLLAILAAFGFATKGLFIKFAYRYGVDAETLLALRMLFAMAIFALVIAARRLRGAGPAAPMAGKDRLHVLLLGFLGYYLSSWLDFRGLLVLPASLERLILLLYPTFTVILTVVWKRQRQPATVWFALPVCYGGIFLVLAHDSVCRPGMLQGVLLVAGSTLSYACYLVLSPPVIARLGSMRFSESVLLVSGGMVLAHFSAGHSPKLLATLPGAVLGYGLLLGFVSTVIPLYALSAAIARIGSARTSVLGMVGPILAVGLSVALLGERLHPVQWLGAATVMAGVFLAGKTPPRLGDSAPLPLAESHREG